MEALSGSEREELAGDANGTGVGLSAPMGPADDSWGERVGDMGVCVEEGTMPASRRALRNFVKREALERGLDGDLAMERREP